MIRAERERQTDDSTREEGEPDTDLEDEKIREKETVKARAARSFRLAETQERPRQIHTQASLLAELTDYIQLHGINSADFSTLYILQRREESERTRDEC